MLPWSSKPLRAAVFALAMLVLAVQPPRVARAHFILNYPKARGTDENLEPQSPCGGFNTVSSARVPFPIDGGSIQLISQHPQATFKVNFAKSSSPDTFLALEDSQAVAAGTWNATVSFTKLNPQGIDVGTEGVLQVTYDGGDGTLYQCSDIALIQAINSTVPSSASPGLAPQATLVPFLVAVASLLS